jgi:peptidyl-prolyl cis-trans isomerase SurA
MRSESTSPVSKSAVSKSAVCPAPGVFLDRFGPAARRAGGALGAAALLIAMATGGAHAQLVAAIVNGEPITQLDVDQRSRLIELSSPTHKAPPRSEVLDELINEKLEIREAKRWGIEASTDDVNDAFKQAASRTAGGKTAAEFGDMLKQAGVTPQTFRARLRAQIVWPPLVRGRFQSSLEIPDQDVLAEMLNKKSDEVDTANFDYTLRNIVFLVPPGSTAAVFDEHKRDAEALRSQFHTCEQGLPYARSLGTAVVRDQIVRSSSDMPAEARKNLDSVPVGQLTAPEITKLGIEMFAVCAKDAAKAENSPGKKQAREALFNERFEAQSKKYLAQLRHDALIEYPPPPPAPPPGTKSSKTR